MKINGQEMIEILAQQLHREFRATEKAMIRRCTKRGSLNILLHDHGFSACGAQHYFRRRAALMLDRASTTEAETLGQAEIALAAEVLRRRTLLGMKGVIDVD